jgi:pimeloyl-ACP methyl ester carboxylesterase
MKPIARVLYHEGYPVHVIEGLGYNRGTVEAMANVVSTYVQEHNLRDCVIVAHSKGGLIGKQLLVQYEAQKIFRGMVAISAPFAGSRYAQLFPLRSLRMFIPDAPLLRALAKNDRVNARIVSIYPAFDPHIPGGSHLQGARNIQVQMYGHFRIIKDRRMHREIIKGMNKL